MKVFCQMTLYALDFDGVLCDSATETAQTAWRAGGAIWPDWCDRPLPSPFLDRFRRLRPALETGYQSIPLMRLAVTEADDDAIFSNFTGLCDEILEAEGMSRQASIDLFASTRDKWIQQDLAGWLDLHAFYPGTIHALQEFMARGTVVIVTTKQERFVKELLAGQGIEVPPKDIYGLERGLKKEVILENFLGQDGFEAEHCHFVEDRLDTLRRLLDRPQLKDIHLYLAEWGYVTAAERAEARHMPRVTMLAQGHLADLARD